MNNVRFNKESLESDAKKSEFVSGLGAYAIEGVLKDGKYGTFIQNPKTEKWSYELKENHRSKIKRELNAIEDTVILSVTDANAMHHEMTVHIEIVNGFPRLEVDIPQSVQQSEIVEDTELLSQDDSNLYESIEVTVTTKDGQQLSVGELGPDDKYTFTLDNGSKVVLDPKTSELSYDGASYDDSGDTVRFDFTFYDFEGGVEIAHAEVKMDSAENHLSNGKISSDEDTSFEKEAHEFVINEIPQGSHLVAGVYEGIYGAILIDEEGATSYRRYAHYEENDEAAQKDLNFTDMITINMELTDGSYYPICVEVEFVENLPQISIDKEASGAYGDPIDGTVPIDLDVDDIARFEVSINGGRTFIEGQADKDGNLIFMLENGRTITLEANGHFTYDGVPVSDSSALYTFDFRLTDAGGNIVEEQSSMAMDQTDSSEIKDEYSDTDSESEKRYQFTFDGMPEGATLADGKYKGEYGSIVVESGVVNFIQDQAYEHLEEAKETSVPEPIPVNVTLADGSVIVVGISVAVVDDVPQVEISEVSTDVYREPIEGVVAIESDADTIVTIEVSIDDGKAFVNGESTETKGFAFEMENGKTIHLSRDGKFTYDGIPIIGSKKESTFNFRVTNIKGDVAERSVLVSVS